MGAGGLRVASTGGLRVRDRFQVRCGRQQDAKGRLMLTNKPAGTNGETAIRTRNAPTAHGAGPALDDPPAEPMARRVLQAAEGGRRPGRQPRIRRTVEERGFPASAGCRPAPAGARAGQVGARHWLRLRRHDALLRAARGTGLRPGHRSQPGRRRHRPVQAVRRRGGCPGRRRRPVAVSRQPVRCRDLQRLHGAHHGRREDQGARRGPSRAQAGRHPGDEDTKPRLPEAVTAAQTGARRPAGREPDEVRHPPHPGHR